MADPIALKALKQGKSAGVKADIAALMPEALADPNVEITYDLDKTEIAEREFNGANCNVGEVAYFPKVTTIGKYAFMHAPTTAGQCRLRTGIFPAVRTIEAQAFRHNWQLERFYAPNCKSLSTWTFSYCENLKAIDFPSIVELVGDSIFADCVALEEISLPNVEKIEGHGAFENCTALKSVTLPAVTSMVSSVFRACTSLEYVDLPVVTHIGRQSFRAAPLKILILRSATLCTIENDTVFAQSGIALGTGYVYVPAALIEEYKADSVWSTYAAQLRAIEDYPEICGEGANEALTMSEASSLIDQKITASRVQPDWNQNDPTAADYVKGRTHYVYTERVEVVTETSFETASSDGSPYMAQFSSDVPGDAVALGDAFVVVYDNKEYDCTAERPTGTNDESFVLGDATVIGGTGAGTGELPFTVVLMPDNGYVAVMTKDTEPTTHTIACYKKEETVHTIDPKFLPAGALGGSGGGLDVTFTIDGIRGGTITTDADWNTIAAALMAGENITARIVSTETGGAASLPCSLVYVDPADGGPVNIYGTAMFVSRTNDSDYSGKTLYCGKIVWTSYSISYTCESVFTMS